MKKLFTGLSAIFGAIPGLLIIKKALGVPPSESEILYGGVIEACGCLFLLLLYINRSTINVLPKKKINRWVLFFFLLFALSLGSYLALYNSFVISYPGRTDTLFPFWNQGKLSREIIDAGSREHFLKYGSDQVKLEINTYSKFSYVVTKIVFIFLYQLVFASLTVAFGICAIRAKKIRL